MLWDECRSRIGKGARVGGPFDRKRPAVSVTRVAGEVAASCLAEVMGMHTIRWRSGATDSGQIPCLPMLGLRQCALPPFPACWGCRIVHRSLAISMALAAVPGACDGLQRCTDLSSVQRRVRRCAGRECSRGARSTREACAEHEKNLLFSAARSARAEAARRSRARRREVRALLCTLAAWKGRGCMVSSV